MPLPNPTDWINRRTAAASRRSRERRMRRFVDALSAAGLRGARILDAGGTRAYWEEWARLLPPGAISRIDVVNLPGQVRDLAGRTLEIGGVPVRFVAANLLDGPCPALDARYDVAHCVSVIEHVGDAAAQRAFADALRRLGDRLWVQTPAKEFPLEAHFRLPFFAWWPLPLRAFFNWRFRLGVMPRHRSWPEAVAFCRSTRLLTRRAFSRLFPSCSLWTERVLGLPKCYIASDFPSPAIHNAKQEARPLVLCAMGGLANRIRAIDSSISLCRRFGRPLRIVWIRDSRQIAARFSDLFEPVDAPDVSVLEATFLDRLRYAPPSWHRNARIPVLWQLLRFGPSRRLSVPRGRILQRAGEIPPQFARRDRTVFLYAWWQMVPVEDRYAFFRPLPPLLAEVDALSAAFPGARTIGVHVRRGDHAHAIRRSPVEAFEARMDALLATGEADSFFLATDDSVVRERLSRRYGPRLLFRNGSSARSTLAGMRGAVVDLWTLARCTRLLASSGSTFAPTAAALGGIPCETVETPAP